MYTSMTRRILGLAVAQAMVDTSTGGGSNIPNPQAMSVETLAAMPDKNSPVPAGKSFSDDGERMGQTIIAAEQSIKVAVKSEESTRLSGLLALCEIADDVGRSQYIGGLDRAFIAVGTGGKRSKTHSNYLTECRRVSGYLREATMGSARMQPPIPWEQAKAAAIAWLNAKEPGTQNAKPYPAKLALFPSQSNAGGATTAVRGTAQGTTATGTTGTGTTQGTQSNAAAQLANAPADTTKPGNVGGATVTFNHDQLIQAIHFAHENDLQDATVALANRLKKSNSPLYQKWGSEMLDFEGIAPQSQEVENPPMAANG